MQFERDQVDPAGEGCFEGHDPLPQGGVDGARGPGLQGAPEQGTKVDPGDEVQDGAGAARSRRGQVLHLAAEPGHPGVGGMPQGCGDECFTGGK